MNGLRYALLGSACLTFAAVPASAQDAPAGATDLEVPAATGAQPAPVGLNEIVVTAQRREENLQDVPIAATAYRGDQLESKAIQAVSDLQFAAPSLSITEAGETQSVNIRGIGIASNSPNVSNGVATYIDGLFQPPIVTSIPFYDIASIEVLRGPQGTLVGNNSTGGAIFVNSQNPKLGRFEGYAQAGYGTYSAYEMEGAVNMPVGDTFALRAAGIYRDRNSFYEDVGPYDNDAGKLEEKGLRVGAFWEPGAFSALLKLQWHEQDTGGYAYRPVEGTDYSAFRVGDIRTLSYDNETAKVERAFLASLELRHEFDSGLTLRSLSGYQYKRNTYLADTDASQAPLVPATPFDPPGGQVTDYFAGERQYSQEINIISPTYGAFDWILGAYYQHNDIVVDIDNISPFPPTLINPRNSRDIFGVFAQGNYQLTDALEFQLGLRYSHFDASGTGGVWLGRGQPGFPPDGVLLADLSGSHTDGRVTGKAAVNWTLSDDHLVYGFVARGYKPGGFESPTAEFEPETVWNYEIGWKGSLADNRIRMQLAAFYNDFQDMQFDILQPSTGTSGVANIGSATIKGIEGQIQARLGGFGIDGGFGYLDSSLPPLTFVNTRALPPGQLGPQCPPGEDSNPPVCFDYGPFIITSPGGPNLYSPEWTYNVGVEYRAYLSDRIVLTPRVNYGYVGSRFNYLAYQPGDLIGSRGLLSALVTLEIDDFKIEGYATNLTDKDYVVGRSGNNEFYGAPREYGVRLGVTF